jgi:hypothetical protein
MRVRFSSLAAALLVVPMLVACVTEPFSASAQPDVPKGVAALYVFRPKEDATGQFSKPRLIVDGAFVAEMPRKSITVLWLEPGVHQLTLETPDARQSVWNAMASLPLQEGRNFVAIWNQGQQTNPGTTMFLPVRPTFLVPLTIGATKARDKVVFETVPEELAIGSLADLELVKARVNSPAANPILEGLSSKTH